MYSVNVTMIPGYEVKIVAGASISIKRHSENTVTFCAQSIFELHVINEGGECVGVVTPGGQPGPEFLCGTCHKVHVGGENHNYHESRIPVNRSMSVSR